MRVLGISGSLRRDSHNTQLLRAAGELVEEQGAEFEVFDGLKAIPPYDEDDDVGDGPAAVARLRQAIADADAVLFATPEYNSSIPGVLKNAVDWASRPLADEPAPQQARRRDRGEHRDVRRRLGAGRAAQGAGRDRRPRDRGRAGRRARPRAPRPGGAPGRSGPAGSAARLGSSAARRARERWRWPPKWRPGSSSRGTPRPSSAPVT